jgi:autotransporter-associated beta strand protein
LFAYSLPANWRHYGQGIQIVPGGGQTMVDALTFNRTDAIVVGNAISGTGTMTMNGTGTLTLSGANSYSGGTTISTGVGSVRLSTANAATNTVWIPMSYAGTTYYVPGYTTNAP